MSEYVNCCELIKVNKVEIELSINNMPQDIYFILIYIGCLTST